MEKEIGIIGQGKMGLNMSLRLLEKGWRVIAHDKDIGAKETLLQKQGDWVNSLEDLARGLPLPRVILMMVPHTNVDEVLHDLVDFLMPGDIIIDGGNSFFKDSIKRGKYLKERGINFLDVGISGGPEGARTGACLMVGGERNSYKYVEHLLKDLAREDFCKEDFLVGSIGAGHAMKMIHNGIEYGMMQALAEGFNLYRELPFNFALPQVAKILSRGSVIESRLVDWLIEAFKQRGESLDDVSGEVSHTGEGEWTVKTAEELKIPVAVIEEALRFRIDSKENSTFTGQILSALREQFGGHRV